MSQFSTMRACLGLLTLLLCMASASPGIAQDDTSGNAVSFDELISNSRVARSKRSIFATDDKALRKSVVSSKTDIVKDLPTTAPAEFHAWMNELLNALESNDLAASSRALAQRHRLPENAVRQLARSFALVQANEYGFFGDDVEDIRNRTRLIADLKAALDEASGNPLLVQFAAFTIYSANFCDKSLLSLPHKAENRPEHYRAIAAVTGCSGPLLEAIKSDPSHQIADLAMLTELLEHQPTLHLWLLRPGVEQHVAPAERRAFKLAMTRKAIGDAFSVGAEARGLSLFDALDPQGRKEMLADKQARFVATIDGLPVVIGAKDDISLRTSLAAAMYLAGRTVEARALIADDPQLPFQRRLVNCSLAANTTTGAGKATDDCSKIDDDSWHRPKIDSLIISWALDERREDPYPMLEAAFSGSMGSSANAPLARLYCSVFEVSVAGSVCADARRSVAYDLKSGSSLSEDEREAQSASNALGLPEWNSIAAMIDNERVASLAAFDDGDAGDAHADRPPVEPIYPTFAQNKLPPKLISSRSGKRSEGSESQKWPRGWKALPEGFEPVRWQREGARAVVISQSGLLDRGGEVGRGGYWVHLSNDGAKTWGQPLYTGLAVRFPYLIEATSKLPLLKDGDLQIEVTYALLDTSSITYPPVALRTLRKESDLWLNIPIEALAKDSNGDGLSDLVAAHLGIDGPADEAPFVAGSDKATCKAGEVDGVAALRRQVLLRLTGIDEAAIFEPIDRAPDAPPLQGVTRISTDGKRPLFVKGQAADLACTAPMPMQVFIYNAKGEEALQRRSPDFRLIELPSLIMNRDKSRGYAVWSSGWTGGTILFWLEAGQWRFRTISSWIT